MLVKCWYCNVKSEKQTMVRVSKGKVNQHYHNSCYPFYLEQEEKKQVEVQEWNDLYETIKLIHEIDVVPTGIIKILKELRDGVVRLNGATIKKHKQGVSFKYITQAYHMAKSTIDYYRKNKPFETKEKELRYCLAIATSKINDVVELERRKKQSEIVNKRVEKQVVHIDEVQKKNKKDDELDISDYL